MFSMRFWDSFGSPGVSCVKLPAAVAFPTDNRLLQRIEEQRRALPANNMKPLWKSREVAVERFPARVAFPQIHAVDVEVTQPTASSDASCCVVPLARIGRVRQGISVSAA